MLLCGPRQPLPRHIARHLSESMAAAAEAAAGQARVSDCRHGRQLAGPADVTAITTCTLTFALSTFARQAAEGAACVQQRRIRYSAGVTEPLNACTCMLDSDRSRRLNACRFLRHRIRVEELCRSRDLISRARQRRRSFRFRRHADRTASRPTDYPGRLLRRI